MKRISTASIGIEQGSHLLFSDFADDGPMWTGNGHRESRFIVTFREPFRAAPAVIVGISLMDVDRATNVRAEIVAEHVQATGFHIVFRTWGDTRVARIRADWTAIGAVLAEDEWEVE